MRENPIHDAPPIRATLPPFAPFASTFKLGANGANDGFWREW